MPPATEKFPRNHGWTILRIAEGSGYWLQTANPVHELNAGDVLIAAPNSRGVIRASSIGPLTIHFFSVQPKLLSGLLTVTEWQQLETAGDKIFPSVFIIPAAEPLAQKFAQFNENSAGDSLSLRCRFLQLWADAVVNVFPQLPPETSYSSPLRDRFRQLIGQLPTAELSTRSLAELAGRLGCSERHFRRLFREEFGTPLRTRQTELRLLRAKQFLAESDDKIINVAYESGYHHLGLFNSSFKRYFGMTPGAWRRLARKNTTEIPRRTTFRALTLLMTLGFLLTTFYGRSQTNSPPTTNVPVATSAAPANSPAPTNAAPLTFEVKRYDVHGNTLLSQDVLDSILSAGTGTNVTFETIVKTLNSLKAAYLERGYMTVAVTLPKQQLTNAVVTVKVAEAPLAAVNIVGNRFFSDQNILRALPDVRTNIMLNAHVLQQELDNANANRDRQIYPSVGPGPLPGTSALTLRVKDRLPVHARAEVNNQATPDTPDLRFNFNAQYGNLWDREHQIGFQYGCTPEAFSPETKYKLAAFDEPLIVNYSGYYRMPLGNPSPLQAQIEENPLNFGYNEATHKFRVPPTIARPSLTVYASRAVVDTGAKFQARTLITNTATTKLESQDSGENLVLNEGLGARLSWPLPQIGNVKPVLSFGLDFKRYRTLGFNTNNFYITFHEVDQFGVPYDIVRTNSNGQTPQARSLDYLPFNAGLDLAIPDKRGITFVNVGANFNFPIQGFGDDATFRSVGYTTNTHAQYFTATMGLSREQKIFKDWTVFLRANGQWSDGALISNEQFALGGIANVRGYREGEVYGDTGWRVSIEPRTPFWNMGGFTDSEHTEPMWARAWTFMDYGEAYLAEAASGNRKAQLWSVGIGGMVGIANNFDAKLTLAWPLIGSSAGTKAGEMGVFFSLGVQF